MLTGNKDLANVGHLQEKRSCKGILETKSGMRRNESAYKILKSDNWF